MTTRYSPKVKRDEGLEEESAENELAQQAKEDERRMKFSFAVAEMIAMESHTKQLLLQVRVGGRFRKLILLYSAMLYRSSPYIHGTFFF